LLGAEATPEKFRFGQAYAWLRGVRSGGIGIHHRLDRNRLVVAIAFAVIVNGPCRISLVSEKKPR
jgi:hypothetical protein